MCKSNQTKSNMVFFQDKIALLNMDKTTDPDTRRPNVLLIKPQHTVLLPDRSGATLHHNIRTKKAHRARGRERHIHNVHAVSSLREQAEGQQFTADKGAPRFISSLQNTRKKSACRLNRQRRRK